MDMPKELNLTMPPLEAPSEWKVVTRKTRPQPKKAINDPKESFYSCSNLELDHPGRYVKASDVRAQVAQIPDFKNQPQAPYVPHNKRHYPKCFENREQFINLESCEPRIEYPLRPKGVQMWRSGGPGNGPDVLRVICDGEKQNRGEFDVAYHDLTKSPYHKRNLTLANYRSPGEAAERNMQEHKKKH